MARRIADAREEGERTRNVGDILVNLIPSNPVKAMADGNMLPIIVFAIMFGLALTLIGEGPRNAVVAFMEGVNGAMIVLVNIIMAMAPYGVFAIIVAVTATLGFDFLISLIKYSAVTIGAMAVYLTVFYGTAVRLLAGIGPVRFFKEMRPVMLIAFSTSSSNATLPENMLVCRERLGVPREVTSFSLPLGATVNMDGTAIYQGISAMFIAQVFGMPLTLEQQAMVVLTASLASIGAAGVPGIGMVTLAMVLSSVNLPPAGIALVLGVERILDMCRTTLNVVGDACGATIVGRFEGGLAPVAEEGTEAASETAG
jgi:Na+/H+-dicarboxylate symporter